MTTSTQGNKRISLLDSMRRDEQEPSAEVMKSFVQTGRVEAKGDSPKASPLAERIEVTTTPAKLRAAVPKPRPSRIHPVALVPVTVRLKPELAGALKRASLERELAGEAVYTQQDIVEEALIPWLKKAGVL